MENAGTGWETRWRKFLPLFVAAAGILAYANSFSGVLLYDDDKTLGRDITQRIASPFRYFRESSRPLADFTFALNASLGGKAADYHAVNLAIHVANALLLFGLVRRTARLLGEGGAADGLAWAAASLWVAHPLTTAAVTFLSQRYESLMAFFHLLTLYCAVRGSVSERRRAWSAAAVGANLLGMMSKETMVTAPVSVLLYDWVFLARGSLREIVRKRGALYAGLAVGWALLGALMAGETANAGKAFYVWGGSAFSDYVATQAGVIWRYLRLAVWPDGLCLDYAWPLGDLRSCVAPVLGLAAVLALVLWGLARRRPWSAPGAVFFLVLAPTSLVPRPDCAVEHRMYVPLAALVCLAVWAGYAVKERLGRAAPGMLLGVQGGGIAVVCAALVGLGAVTIRRNALYGSQEAMWRQVVGARPGNVRARLNLACALLDKGDNRGAADLCAEALRMLRDFSRVGDDSLPKGQGRSEDIVLHGKAQLYAHARNFLGVALARTGRREEAARHFGEALRVAPGFADAKRNLDLAIDPGNKTAPP